MAQWDIHQAGIRGIEGVLPNDKPEWKAVLFDRMNSTYQRDKNHPAVLIWSLGNESFGGETLLQMAEMVRRFDDTRLVHYEGVVNDPPLPRNHRYREPYVQHCEGH